VKEVRSQKDRQIRSAMKFDVDFGFRNGDGSWHIQEIAEDLPGLGVGVAAHTLSEQAIEAGRDDQERHIEIDFHAHGGG